MEKTFSVIIPTKRRRYLFNCIKSLVEQDYPSDKYEVIIVDDYPGDFDWNALPSSRNLLYFKGTNQGGSVARNLGISHSSGKYIVFIDDDCYASPTWLQSFENAILQTPSYAGYGGKVLGNNGDGFIAEYCEYRGMLQRPVENGRGEIINIITCNACFKKSALIDVGGIFVPTFTDGQILTLALHLADVDDIDLTYRLVSQGYHLGFVPDALVYHHFRSTLKGLIIQHIRFGQNGFLHCYFRRRSPKEIGNPGHSYKELIEDLFNFCRHELPKRYSTYQEDGISLFNTPIYLILDLLRRISYIAGIRIAHDRVSRLRNNNTYFTHKK